MDNDTTYTIILHWLHVSSSMVLLKLAVKHVLGGWTDKQSFLQISLYKKQKLHTRRYEAVNCTI